MWLWLSVYNERGIIMKKLLCIILSITFVFLLCGCGDDTDNSSESDKVYKQEVTIVKMPSPPKCKTTNSIAVVDEVIGVLGLIEKSPANSDNVNGGWSIMVELNIDGKELSYTIGNIFTDADGKQYKVTNLDEIEGKINKIYDKIDSDEVEYK